jgi:hypothetical protein
VSVEYCRCRDCKTIYRRGNLPREYIEGTLVMRAYCPVDNSQLFDTIDEPVCEHCEKALAQASDDYCAPCSRIVDEEQRDFEQDHAAVAAQQPDDIGEAMIDIAYPWRRAS